MASLYAVMTRRTVTATVSGLDEEHEAGRIFRWYLDGVLKKTETVMDAITSRTCDIAGVRYASTHTVKVAISTASTDELFTTLTAYVADNLKLWDWSASNGDATAAQVSEAYTSANSQGLTADFSYLVWNDIVNGVYDVLTGRGEMWNTRYASLAETLMETAGDPLTADRFNSLVNNMQYEYPYWRNQRSRNGYLGRLAVLGQTTMGKNADIVYGEYFFELTYILNVLIDALGELDAGYAKLLKHTSTGGLRTSESLPLRVPGSRRMVLTKSLWLSEQVIGVTAPKSRRMEQETVKKTDASILFRAPESRPLPITKRMRSIRSIVLTPQNERPMNLIYQIVTARSALISPDAAAILKLAWEIASVGRASPTWAGSFPIAASCASLTSAECAALTPSPSFYLSASVASLSSLAAVLIPSDESNLVAGISNASGDSVVLSPAPSSPLVIDWSARAETTQRIHLIANKAPQLAHDVKFAPSIIANLVPVEAALMAHDGTAAIPISLDAYMISPAAANLEHDVEKLKLSILAAAGITVDAAVHFAYDSKETIRAAFLAEFRAPKAVNMAYDSKETIRAAFLAVPTVADSVHMDVNLTTKIVLVSEALLAPIPSKPLAADITEKLNDVCDAVLTPTDAEPLAVADGARSALEGVLSPLPSAAMAHEGMEPVDGAAEMRSPDAADGGVVSVVITALSAALETKSTFEWVIRRGNDLYIRAAWFSAQYGSNLEIDTWLAPIRRGNDLYIKQMYTEVDYGN